MNASNRVLNDKQEIQPSGFCLNRSSKHTKTVITTSPIVFSVNVCVCVCVGVYRRGLQLAKSRIVPVYKLCSQSQFPEEDTHTDTHTHVQTFGSFVHCCFITWVSRESLCGLFLHTHHFLLSCPPLLLSGSLPPSTSCYPPPSLHHCHIFLIHFFTSSALLCFLSVTPLCLWSFPVLSSLISSLLPACLPVTPFLCE